MITPEEKKILLDFLALSKEPEDTFTYDELLGYFYGLAITPGLLLPSEWIPLIFGGDMPAYDSVEQMEGMNACLLNIYNRYHAAFLDKTLEFPFQLEELDEHKLDKIYEWVSGLEEALFLREEIWDPEEYPGLDEKKKGELFHALMTIQGLVDPMEANEFFEDIPDEVFQQTIGDAGNPEQSRDTQLQLLLLSSLPLAAQTLRKHADTVENSRKDNLKGKKNNVIKVDFSKKGK